MRHLLLFGLVVLTILLSSCLTAGTHGSIKWYRYPVRKQLLQEAAEQVIFKNKHIHRNEASQKNFIVDVTNGKNDTMRSENNFNDGDRYVSITEPV